jgi:hypothetical protein
MCTFYETFQRLVTANGIQLGITIHCQGAFNVVKRVKLYHIPRNLCHDNMTRVVAAYPDVSCLCSKGMSNSRDLAEFYQHLRNSCHKAGGNLLNPRL